MQEHEGPLAELNVLGQQHVSITDALEHHEIYTFEGLLTLLWHRRPAIERRNAVLFCGGAMGGLLGPAEGLFHDLGTGLAADGVGQSLRVGYRVPNDLERCVFDTLAAAQVAQAGGAERFVVVGHSFGGAVAIQAAAALAERCVGVVTLATQSAGCEAGESLNEPATPVLLVHGDRDAILPFYASQMVQFLTGGELVILPGADHLFSGAGAELRARLGPWIAQRFAR